MERITRDELGSPVAEVDDAGIAPLLVVATVVVVEYVSIWLVEEDAGKAPLLVLLGAGEE